MKNFEDQLYESVACVLPDLTVRKMSKIMGKSEGYWSSLMAQKLTVSNDALCHLIAYLETRKVTASSTPEVNRRITTSQRLISQEIVARFNAEYRDCISDGETQGTQTSREEGHWQGKHHEPLPFIVQYYG